MKKKKILALLLVVALILPSTILASNTAGEEQAVGSRYSNVGLLVLFEKGSTRHDSQAVKNAFGLTSVKKFDSGVELMTIGKGADPAVLGKAMSKNKHVTFAHPDYIIERPEVVTEGIDTSDTYSGELWGMDVIDAPEAWAAGAKGAGVVVAVIDSGIMVEHEDLAGNIWENPGEIDGNGIDDDNNGYVDDIHGWNVLDETNEVFEGADALDEYGDPEDEHGTHVAGTIAGVANNVGVVGVAPEVKVMSVKFFGSSSLSGYTSEAIQAIEYATDNGADVINASWGGGSRNRALEVAIKAFQGVFVAAAGNSGLNTDISAHYPSSYRANNILSIASSDYVSNEETGRLSVFSNYGYKSVDVAAPGGGIFQGFVNIDGRIYMSYSDLILSCFPYDTEATNPTKYISMGGTSMATPHAAGVVALMLGTGNYDGSSAVEVIADVKASGLVDSELQGLIASGAVINAYNAVTYRGEVPDPVNNIPTSEDIQVETELNTPITIQLIGDDLDGDLLSFIADANSVNGGTITYDGSTREATYTPLGGFTGDDSFTYKAYDGEDYSTAANVTITVTDSSVEPPILTYTDSTNNSDASVKVLKKKILVSDQAMVTVTDSDGSVASGIIVNAQWTGLMTGEVSGVTDASGEVIFSFSRYSVPSGTSPLESTLEVLSLE